MKLIFSIILFGLLRTPFASANQLHQFSQFNQAENNEILQALVFLSVGRNESLSNRMEKMPLLQNLLLQSWLLSGQTNWLAISNSLGGVNSLYLSGRYPEIYAEFMASWDYGFQMYRGRKLNQDELRQRAEYWDCLAEVDLSLISDHAKYGFHSDAFIAGSIQAINWLEISDNESVRAYSMLTNYMTMLNQVPLRREIFDALFLFKKNYPTTFTNYSSNADIYISQRSLYWLVYHGYANYLLSYIRQSWRLSRQNEMDGGGRIAVAADIQNLLAPIIPQSGSLITEKGQLSWVKKNILLLKWDIHKKIFFMDN